MTPRDARPSSQPHPPAPLRLSRGNQLGIAGWTALAEALECVTSLTSLNGSDQYAAIRAGGQAELDLGGTELGVWATRFLKQSASTLTTLDVRCSLGMMRMWRDGKQEG